VIDYVNAHLIPVWVNVREDRYPRVPALADRDWVLFTTDDGTVLNLYYRAFLSRTYVLSPDLYTLLNDDDGLWHQTGLTGEFLAMLERAVARGEKPPVVAATRYAGRGAARAEGQGMERSCPTPGSTKAPKKMRKAGNLFPAFLRSCVPQRQRRFTRPRARAPRISQPVRLRPARPACLHAAVAASAEQAHL
jgi:hypothetical protein